MHSPLQQEDSIHIKVSAPPPSAGAATADHKPIIVNRSLLSVYSSCARGLPADAIEWDVSQLVLLGQPVKRETVVKWLNAAYKPINGDDNEHAQINPASSMTGLAQLLAFADAVGSSRGLLLAFDADAMDLTADVQLSSQTPAEPSKVQLQMGRGHRFVPIKRGVVSLMGFTPSTGDMTAITNVGSDKAAVQQQVAEQIEALPCLAYKLKLPVLKSSLCRMIACNSSQSVSSSHSPLLDSWGLQTIMSDSLMAAAGCSNKGDMLKALFPQQLAYVLRPLGGVTPVAAGGLASNHYEYSAEVAEAVMYYKRGQKVVVKTEHFLSPSFELWLDRSGTSTPHMSYRHTVNVQHLMVPAGTLHI